MCIMYFVSIYVTFRKGINCKFFHITMLKLLIILFYKCRSVLVMCSGWKRVTPAGRRQVG